MNQIARGPLRLRLTLLTSSVFLVVGAALMALTYFLVAATIPNETPAEAQQHQERLSAEQSGKSKQSPHLRSPVAAAPAPATQAAPGLDRAWTG